MSTFTIQAMLINPAQPDRSLVAELMVDTAATYTLLPMEIVAELSLSTLHDQPVELASGERVTYRLGQVLIGIDGRERVTPFLVGPLGARPLLGAVTLEEFALAPDPVHRRLVPVPALL